MPKALHVLRGWLLQVPEAQEFLIPVEGPLTASATVTAHRESPVAPDGSYAWGVAEFMAELASQVCRAVSLVVSVGPAASTALSNVKSAEPIGRESRGRLLSPVG
jgi:hypothetical protein